MKNNIQVHTASHAETDASSPRVYLLTDSRLYEIVFLWSNEEEDCAEGKEMYEWQSTLLGPLHELPMKGYELSMMTDNVHDGNSSLLSISSQFREYQNMDGVRCSPSRVGDRDLALPRPFLFVVRSFTPLAIHERIKSGQWYYEAYSRYMQGKGPQPPLPSDEPLSNESGEPLYDVMPVSRNWNEQIPPKTRLTWLEVEELIREAEQAGGVIALHYYAETQPRDGGIFDSLVWLNSSSFVEAEPTLMVLSDTSVE